MKKLWNLSQINRLYFSINLCFLILQIFVYTPAHSSALLTQPASLKYQLSSDNTKTFSLPSDVAANSKQVFIVDGGNHRIVVFDKQG
ncbi:MAG: hypothetical protein KAT90_11030, partial [Gammaproteobacteria bacterium]|nr:hypothetical protein [Gammaproteobacteria bacterium]